MLNVPYRQMLNYSPDLLKQAETDYEKIRRVVISFYRKLELSGYNVSNELLNKKYNGKNEEIKALLDEFINFMSNDFNTPNAITTIFKLTKVMNTLIRSKDTSLDTLFEYLNALYNMLWVLGINYDVKALTDEEKELVNKWNEAKANKDFTQADIYRNEINNRNILL